MQILAVLSGLLTAFLAKDYLPPELADATKGWSILGLGLLASGGSGFWNSILTYVTKVKDIKKVEAEEKKNETEEKKQAVGPYQVYQDLKLGDEQVTSNECYDVEDK